MGYRSKWKRRNYKTQKKNPYELELGKEFLNTIEKQDP